jgi:ribosome maturation factor RimP
MEEKSFIGELSRFVDKKIDLWTVENSDCWTGILKHVYKDHLVLMVEGLDTYISLEKVTSFRLSVDRKFL